MPEPESHIAVVYCMTITVVFFHLLASSSAHDWWNYDNILLCRCEYRGIQSAQKGQAEQRVRQSNDEYADLPQHIPSPQKTMKPSRRAIRAGKTGNHSNCETISGVDESVATGSRITNVTTCLSSISRPVFQLRRGSAGGS